VTVWQVQHARTYSETDVTDWAVELHLVMPEWDWQTVRPLFEHVTQFTIGPEWADRMAGVLQEAACSSRMHPAAVRMTEEIAAAARTAADRREPWRWH
jgi:hypothetical protein